MSTLSGMTIFDRDGGATRGRYRGPLRRRCVAGMLVVLGCHAPGTPVPAPPAAVPAPADSGIDRGAAPVLAEERLEFRLADSVTFPGAEAKPRLFEGRRIYAGAVPLVGTAEFRSVESAISEHGMPVLNLELCPEAGERLARVTADRIGGQMMILAGNTVLSVAIITGPFGDRVQVAGLGTLMKTMAFASVIQPRLRAAGCAARP